MRQLTKSEVENISGGYNGNGPSSGMTSDGGYGGQANGRVGNSSGGMSSSCAAGLGAGIIGGVVAGSYGGLGGMIVSGMGGLIAGSGNCFGSSGVRQTSNNGNRGSSDHGRG